MKNCISCSSPSKIILFGEHAVVYGFPAIVAAISKRSFCEIKPRSDDNFLIDLKDFQSSKLYGLKDLTSPFIESDKQFSSFFMILKRMNEFYSFNSGFDVQLYSDIPIAAGLGSSASLNVSLVNGINHFFQLNLSKEKISSFAYIGEKVVHGTPSGIDNTIATYGGLLYYENKKFTHFEKKGQLTLIVSNTKIQRNTGELVKNVRNLYESKKEFTSQVFQEIKEIVIKAKNLLLSNKLKDLGVLMNKNQELLTKLGVSNNEIKTLTKLAIENGALGSKLTGAGGGGCIISLLDRDTDEKQLLNILNKKADSFKVTLDPQGTILQTNNFYVK
ncbi:MAG: mevalonate kinase [Candidatus Helarchaeota archaeon]